MTTRQSRRLAGALGIVSFPLVVSGFLLIMVDVPGADEPGSAFVSYFTDNTGQIWVGAILSVLGLAAFLAFLGAGLRQVARPAAPAGGGLSGLVLAAGTAWALFTLVGVTLVAGTAGATEFFDGFALDPDTARLVLGMSWLPSIYGGLAATVVVAATSLGAKRTGALPKTFVRTGYVVVVLLFVAALVGVAGLLFAAWVLAASVVLIRSSDADTRAAATHVPSATGSPA